MVGHRVLAFIKCVIFANATLGAKTTGALHRSNSFSVGCSKVLQQTNVFDRWRLRLSVFPVVVGRYT